MRINIKKGIQCIKDYKWLFLFVLLMEFLAPTKQGIKNSKPISDHLKEIYDTTTISGTIDFNIQLFIQTFHIKHPIVYAIYTTINDMLNSLF